MHEPAILFLDEPTSGVDPVTRREFWTHINGVVEKGVTVMVTTHFMDEAEYCDRIALVFRGKIIAAGTPRSLVDGLGNVQFLEFETPDTLDTGAITALSAVESVEHRGQHYRVRLDRSLGALSTVLAEIDRQHATPIGLNTHQATLDDVFIQLTGRALTTESTPP